MGLEQQYLSIVRSSPHYVEIPGLMDTREPNTSSGIGISAFLLWVSGVRDCCSVILMGQSLAGITHYNLRTGSPENYLVDLINQMKAENQIKLAAGVVGGDEEHFQRIVMVLRAQGVPVKGMLRDRGRDRHWKDKSVVALPKTGEVIVEVKDYAEYRYVRLMLRFPFF